MKVKDGANGELILDGKPLQGAEEAFREERVLEAFALISALIDWRMLNLYQMKEMGKGVPTPEIHHDNWEEVKTFRQLVSYLVQNKVISGKVPERFREFYVLRNKIVHRLIIYSYQPYAQNRVLREEAIRGFEEGKFLAELLRKINPESSGRGEGWTTVTGGG